MLRLASRVRPAMRRASQSTEAPNVLDLGGAARFPASSFLGLPPLGAHPAATRRPCIAAW